MTRNAGYAHYTTHQNRALCAAVIHPGSVLTEISVVLFKEPGIVFA